MQEVIFRKRKNKSKLQPTADQTEKQYLNKFCEWMLFADGKRQKRNSVARMAFRIIALSNKCHCDENSIIIPITLSDLQCASSSRDEWLCVPFNPKFKHTQNRKQQSQFKTTSLSVVVHRLLSLCFAFSSKRVRQPNDYAMLSSKFWMASAYEWS